MKQKVIAQIYGFISLCLFQRSSMVKVTTLRKGGSREYILASVSSIRNTMFAPDV